MRCLIYMLGILGVFFLAISIAHAVELEKEVVIIESHSHITGPWEGGQYCETQKRKRGWTNLCRSENLEFELPQDLDISKIKEATIAGWGYGFPSGDGMKYFVNKGCNVSYEDDCTDTEMVTRRAPGKCEWVHHNGYQPTKCQYPPEARDKWCDGSKCKYEVYACVGDIYTKTMYNCNWTAEGSIYFQKEKYYYGNPTGKSIPTSSLKPGLNTLGLARISEDKTLHMDKVSLLYTIEVECVEDSDCNDSTYCGEDNKCYENYIPPTPEPNEQEMMGFKPASGSGSDTQIGSQQTDNAIIYGSALAAGLASVGVLGLVTWKNRSTIQMQLNQMSSSLNRANTSMENLNACIATDTNVTSTFADIFPDNSLAKIARYWGYEFEAAKEWVTGTAIPKLKEGWNGLAENPKDVLKEGLISVATAHLVVYSAIASSLSNAKDDPVGWLSSGANKIGSAIKSGATAYWNALKDDPLRTLGKTAITIASVLGIVGGIILAPVTGGGSLALTYAGYAGLAGAGMIFAQGSYEGLKAKTEEERKQLATEHVDDLIWIPSGAIGGAQSLKLGTAIKPTGIIKLSTKDLTRIGVKAGGSVDDVMELSQTRAFVLKAKEGTGFFKALKSLGYIKEIPKKGVYYFENTDLMKSLSLKSAKAVQWHEAGHITQAKGLIKAPSWAWRNNDIAESIADKFASKFVGSKALIRATPEHDGRWLRMFNLKQIKNSVKIPVWLNKPLIAYKAPVLFGATVLKQSSNSSGNSGNNTTSSGNKTSTVKSTVTKAASTVKTTVTKAVNTVKSTVTKAASTVKSAVTKAANTVKKAVSNVAKKITSVFKKKK